MLKRWVAAMLVVFLAVNGLVVAGDSTIHASHDTPGLSLHADGDIKNVSAAFPMDADDGGYHDCHNPACYAPFKRQRGGCPLRSWQHLAAESASGRSAVWAPTSRSPTEYGVVLAY